MKNQKAITLVAMVITIIVMLILAGVSISMVTGDNGVLTRAQEGSIKTKLASIQSDIGLALTSVQTDYYNSFAETKASVGKKWTYLTVENLNNYLNQCKLVYDCSNNDVGVNIKNEASFKITNSYMNNGIITNKTPLTYICASTVNIENNSSKGYPIIDGFSSTEFKSSQYGYIESIGYQCSYLFFSNGKYDKSLGGDLYIAIIHFENGFFKLDDIGVAKSQGRNSKNKNLDLNQGMIANSESNELDSLNIEWLNNII